MAIVKVTESNFEQEVLRAEGEGPRRFLGQSGSGAMPDVISNRG